MSRLAIHYRRQFFQETTKRVPAAATQPGIPRGLVGREVANAEMLTALLRYGKDDTLTFVVHDDADVEVLSKTLQTHLPDGKKAIVTRLQGLDRWMNQSQHRVIWEPQPPSAGLIWTRGRVAPSHVAVAGLTHALCSPIAVLALRELVAAPVRQFDRLVCTSAAVAHTARTLIEHWAHIVGKGHALDMISPETIPLGIDCERHRPATAAERQEVRQRLNIPDDAGVVLFMGRLSFHAKSNPLPMYAACQRAAERTGKPVYLLLAGWYASAHVERGFQEEARRIAPDVQLLHVDAMDPAWRDTVWAAADVFVSLADSVQETFGLTVVEAMSRGLPVVASDWNGYRETVRHGETGFLVPTTMVCGAGERALLAMHEGKISYDQFLAAVGQTVGVSTHAAGNAIENLLSSPELRQRMAKAGHRHARENYSWRKIIGRYERLWRDQRSIMAQQPWPSAGARESSGDRKVFPAVVPPLREMFDRYPTAWVEHEHNIEAGTGSLGEQAELSQSKIAGHGEMWRLRGERRNELFERLSAPGAQKMNLHELAFLYDSQADAEGAEGDAESILDTIAWGIKYDLLQPAQSVEIDGQKRRPVRSFSETDITFTTTCMGRLAHLQQTLPRLVAQPGCHVVVADYSCPQGAGAWVRDNFSPDEVTVVHVPERSYFDRSEAKNAAISAAKTPWVCVIDADVVVREDFADEIRARLAPRRLVRCMSIEEGVGGTFVASRTALQRVGFHDPVYKNWGEEDFDLLDALLFIGEQLTTYPEELVSHLEHDETLRTQFHAVADRWVSHLTNRLYRAAKWDWARITGEIPSLEARRRMYDQISSQVRQAAQNKTSTTVSVPLGKRYWHLLKATGARILTYRVDFDDSP